VLYGYFESDLNQIASDHLQLIKIIVLVGFDKFAIDLTELGSQMLELWIKMSDAAVGIIKISLLENISHSSHTLKI